MPVLRTLTYITWDDGDGDDDLLKIKYKLLSTLAGKFPLLNKDLLLEQNLSLASTGVILWSVVARELISSNDSDGLTVGRDRAPAPAPNI